MLAQIQKKWWLVLLRGVLPVVFGLVAIFSPGIVLMTLLVYFGIVAVLCGVFLVIEGFSIRGEDRGMRIWEGVLSIFFGLLFIILPEFILDLVMYLIAIWAILGGIMQIFHAIELRKLVANEWLAILNGVITLAFGILIILNIRAGAQALVMFFGAYAIISGLLMIGFS
ncbi:MAG: DUF308 domain-containing protein, partial [Bacteroidota bacterium]|nr:DUF308 domain-containing protein [Bacteroidota bacterium]